MGTWLGYKLKIGTLIPSKCLYWKRKFQDVESCFENLRTNK